MSMALLRYLTYPNKLSELIDRRSHPRKSDQLLVGREIVHRPHPSQEWQINCFICASLYFTDKQPFLRKSVLDQKQGVNGNWDLATPSFFFYVQNNYRHRGTGWKLAAQGVALPGNVLLFILCPLAPPPKRS